MEDSGATAVVFNLSTLSPGGGLVGDMFALGGGLYILYIVSFRVHNHNIIPHSELRRRKRPVECELYTYSDPHLLIRGLLRCLGRLRAGLSTANCHNSTFGKGGRRNRRVRACGRIRVVSKSAPLGGIAPLQQYISYIIRYTRNITYYDM